VSIALFDLGDPEIFNDEGGELETFEEVGGTEHGSVPVSADEQGEPEEVT
jgi:hypothetical protein